MRRTLMVFLLGLVALSVLAQAPPAKPDRSAEPRLRQIFEAMGALKSVHAQIDRVSRTNSRRPFMPEGRTEVHFRADGSFRVQNSGSWGDEALYVSDGKTLLVDPMTVAWGTWLKDAKAAIYESDVDLAAKGNACSPFYYFLAGAKGMAALVAKDGDVVPCTGEAGEEGIRFKSILGTMRVYIQSGDKGLRVRRIDYDNLELRKQNAVLYADWGAEEPEDPLDVHSIHYVSVNRRLPGELFSTKPPKGIECVDRREKKAAPPLGTIRQVHLRP